MSEVAYPVEFRQPMRALEFVRLLRSRTTDAGVVLAPGVSIYSAPIFEVVGAVTLYATPEALALARWLGLQVRETGAAVRIADLPTGAKAVFGGRRESGGSQGAESPLQDPPTVDRI